MNKILLAYYQWTGCLSVPPDITLFFNLADWHIFVFRTFYVPANTPSLISKFGNPWSKPQRIHYLESTSAHFCLILGASVSSQSLFYFNITTLTYYSWDKPFQNNGKISYSSFRKKKNFDECKNDRTYIFQCVLTLF
jgi:hypothetical protein